MNFKVHVNERRASQRGESPGRLPDLRVAGNDVEAVPVAAIHLPEGEVQVNRVFVQAAEGRSWKRTGDE